MSEPKNAEEIEVTFRSKWNTQYKMSFSTVDDNWHIEKYDKHSGLYWPFLKFKNYSDANDCAKLIKRSV